MAPSAMQWGNNGASGEHVGPNERNKPKEPQGDRKNIENGHTICLKRGAQKGPKYRPRKRSKMAKNNARRTPKYAKRESKMGQNKLTELETGPGMPKKSGFFRGSG